MRLRHRLRYDAAAFASICAVAPLAMAGAFNQAPGHGQIIVTGTFADSSRYFDARGRPLRGASWRKFETSALVEYGLFDWLTAFAKPSLVATRIEAPLGADYAGLGGSELGAQVRLFRGGPFSATLAAGFRAPGGRDDGNPARHGDVTSGAEIRASAGAGFSLLGRPAFVDLQAAWRWRAGAPPDEWRLDATFGLRPADRLQLLLQSFNVLSAGAGRPPWTAFRYHKVQASLVYELSAAWSIQVGAFATPLGERAAREIGLLAALWRRF